MPWNKKKSYNLLKSDKKSNTANSGTYTKKKTETRKISNSSSSSSANSSTGLISKLPKQANAKNFIKYYRWVDQ